MSATLAGPGFHFQADFASRSCSGEFVSGDVAVIKPTHEGMFLGLADVLGHGREAAPLAATIGDHMLRLASDRPDIVLSKLHELCKGSRGAVCGMAHVAYGTGILRFAGVGNITIRVLGNAVPSRLPTHAGILGGRMGEPRVHEMRLDRGALVLMFSDGVRDRFKEDSYPQMRLDPARMVAGKVIARFGRAHDDATCIALKVQR